MRRTRSQISLAIVALILGVLVVLQLKTQAGPTGLAGLSTQELTSLVANLNDRNAEFRTEVATLDRELSRGQASVEQIRRDLANLRAWAGLAPVAGPGVLVTIGGAVPGPAVEAVLNELRNAGAEGLSVDGVRVVPGVVIAGRAGTLTLDGRPLPDPFDVAAIGSPENLTGSLTRAGGVIALLGSTNPEATVTVTPVEQLELAATNRSLVPRNGRPRL